MRCLLLTPALALTACTNVVLPAGSAIQFDPLTYFAGRSHGDGTLKIVFSSPKTVTVESFGAREGGGVRLRQAVREQGKPLRWREWRIRSIAPGRYSGTLTDAAGPVTITAQGPRATIRYRMKNGMEVEQKLALQADGLTLLNHMTVRKWGIRVAQLDETIRKAGT